MANNPKQPFLEVKSPPPAGQSHPCLSPCLPATCLNWTPAVEQTPPGLSHQKSVCWTPAPCSPSTRVTSASPWPSLLRRNSAMEMRCATRSLSCLTPASRSVSTYSLYVDSECRHSFATRHSNNLIPPLVRTTCPWRGGTRTSTGLPPRAVPGRYSAPRQ